jgi:hypothetical protein
MCRFLALTLAAGTAVVSTAVPAATTKERVRGEVTSMGGGRTIQRDASRAGARSASGAACRWTRSCAASAPTFRPVMSLSNASMAIRPASTWPARCTRRPFWCSIPRKSRWRRKGGAPLRLPIPTKLGFKSAKNLEAIEVTNKYPAGYWQNQGYDWFAGV